MRGNVHTQFLNTIVLSPVEKADITNTIGRTDYPISEIPGRAFVEWDNVEVLQINTLISNNEELFVAELDNLVRAINEECTCENGEFVSIADAIDYQKYILPKDKVYAGHMHTNQQPAILGSTSIVIDGYNLSGKTNFVKLLIEQYRETSSICILDDSSYTLLEYSETENITYVTDAKEIDYDVDIVVINTFARLDKLKPKESDPILERLFLMHLQGKKFIVENSGKGIEKRKGDFFTALQNSQYFVYLGLPTDQDLYAVNKQKYKKEEFVVKDAYIFSQKGVNKVRVPKVITGNEDKEFIIPELRDIAENNKLALSNLAILGSDYQAVISKILKDYSNKSFKVYDPNNELKLETNATPIALENADEITKGDIVILHGISELDKLTATERREKQDILNSLDNVVIAIQTEKHRFTCKQTKEIKDYKRYVICGSYEDDSVMSVYKRPSRKMTAFKLTPKQVLEVNDKELKTIKL